MKKKSMVLEALHAKLAQEELDDSAIDGVSEAVDDSDIGTDTEAKQKEAADTNVEGADNADDTKAKEEGDEAAGTGDNSGAADADEVEVAEDADAGSDDSGAADEAGEGDEEKQEPSADAEVTELPESLDEQPNVEESEKDEDEDDEEEETEEEIVAKADAVADLADAKQSLEEIADQIEATLQDGGLSPEASVVVQGAVDDILESVDITPIGLPSQESFGTFEGRRANTRLVLESVAVGINKIAIKIYEMIRKMINFISDNFNDNSRKLDAIGKKADAAISKVDADTTNKRIGVEMPVNGPAASAIHLELNSFNGKLDKKSFVAIGTTLAAIGNDLAAAAAVAVRSLDSDGQFDISKLSQNKVLNYRLENGIKTAAFGWQSHHMFVDHRGTGQKDFSVSVDSISEAKEIMKISKSTSIACSECSMEFKSKLAILDSIIKRLETNGRRPTDEQTAGMYAVKALVIDIAKVERMFISISSGILNIGIELYNIIVESQR